MLHEISERDRFYSAAAAAYHKPTERNHPIPLRLRRILSQLSETTLSSLRRILSQPSETTLSSLRRWVKMGGRGFHSVGSSDFPGNKKRRCQRGEQCCMRYPGEIPLYPATKQAPSLSVGMLFFHNSHGNLF